MLACHVNEQCRVPLDCPVCREVLNLRPVDSFIDHHLLSSTIEEYGKNNFVRSLFPDALGEVRKELLCLIVYLYDI